jgi:signal transduction histidine kinase
MPILASGGIAIFLANIAGGNAPALSAALAAANIVEVATAAVLLIKLQQDQIDLTRVRSLCIFFIAAGGIAPVVGAGIGAAAVSLAHAIALPAVWWSWFASDALGMVIVGPFLLTLSSEQWRSLHMERRHAEAVGLLVLIVTAVGVASYYRAFLFIVVPVILVAIFRFGIVGAAVAMLLVAFVGSVFIIKGIGPPVLPQATPSERILALQIFLAATALWSFPVAAVLAERDCLLAGLDAANSRLQADNQKKSQMVTGLYRRLVNVEEQERLRLSHELHDQTGQTLAAALLELSGIEKRVGQAERDRLYRLRQQVEQIAQTVHRISWKLRPAAIDELGLASALSNYASEWSAQFGIATDFHCNDAGLDRLSDDARVTIYRVVGEALTNVSKHARGASAVSIVINREQSQLHVTIEDDGCGFGTTLAPEHIGKHAGGGLGLAGMRERLLLVGGELEVESSPGVGTTVFARIPYDLGVGEQ